MGEYGNFENWLASGLIDQEQYDQFKRLELEAKGNHNKMQVLLGLDQAVRLLETEAISEEQRKVLIGGLQLTRLYTLKIV